MNNTRNKKVFFLIFKIAISLLTFYAIFWFVGFINGYVACQLGTTTMSNASFDFAFLAALVGILYYTSARIRS